ncbi:hypothetical protein G4G27_13810 [Sphingomonas sp. So64.6b]|uniref:hypothetical protein n=1 Tax=Sphingomonas sp. So64.6b TaxID=2997354 RepID=UPI0015FFBC5A|nr:hypothetical protein [Sphingomonas sp. So64.6b]QNA84950.1 hypothetical protein G4G27_13810 [Sphingomonas sp. So64.6b]
MASKRSQTDLAPDWTGPRIAHADAVERLTARRGAAGVTDLPRNAGKNRTASKKALLAAIEKSGGRW